MANVNKSLLRCELSVNQSELTINKLLNPKPKFEMPTSKCMKCSYSSHQQSKGFHTRDCQSK